MKQGLNFRHFLAAAGIAVGLLLPYEYYFRQIEGWVPGYDDNAEIWSHWRRKVDQLSDRDIVILGSSRAHFDLNIHLFDSATDRKPVMLATPGGSPFHVLPDIVNNTEFKGLLILSVSPGLFFTTADGFSAIKTRQDRVEFARTQTYASRFSQWVYQGMDPHLAYLEPDISFKALIHRLPFPDRDSVRHEPIWPPFVSMDRYRNIRMIDAMETDTSFQGRQTRIWDSFGWRNPYKDSIDVILSHYAGHIATFKARGGRVVLLRPPVNGKYLEMEPQLYPREQYWDELLRRSECKGHHFDDHPETSSLQPPEWSHLTKRDADIYTRAIIRFLKQEGLL